MAQNPLSNSPRGHYFTYFWGSGKAHNSWTFLGETDGHRCNSMALFLQKAAYHKDLCTDPTADMHEMRGRWAVMPGLAHTLNPMPKYGVGGGGVSRSGFANWVRNFIALKCAFLLGAGAPVQVAGLRV